MRDRLKQLPPVALVILGTILAIVLLAVFKPSAPTRDVSERHDRVRVVLALEGTVVGEAEEVDRYVVRIDGCQRAFRVDELIESSAEAAYG